MWAWTCVTRQSPKWHHVKWKFWTTLFLSGWSYSHVINTQSDSTLLKTVTPSRTPQTICIICFSSQFICWLRSAECWLTACLLVVCRSRPPCAPSTRIRSCPSDSRLSSCGRPTSRLWRRLFWPRWRWGSRTKTHTNPVLVASLPSSSSSSSSSSLSQQTLHSCLYSQVSMLAESKILVWTEREKVSER